MIDTHCHLTYDGLRERVAEVVACAGAAGVDRMITIGTTPDDAGRAVEVAERFANVFAAVGVHPHYAADWTDRGLIERTIRNLARHPKVVAIGEMGLDRHYPDPPIEDQRHLLEWQLGLAAELRDLPIIIHNREATDEILSMLRRSGLPGGRFVFHCFTGSARELDAVLDFGAMAGFTGVVTFKNASDLAEAAARVPDDRLLIETDAPYLTPEPHRKVRPNEPCFVPHVARFLAQKRQVEEKSLISQVDANAMRFFRLEAGNHAASRPAPER